MVVFRYLAWIAGFNVTNKGLLIALAATLPWQIDLSYNVHGLASGWNDRLAVWTRMTGACAAIQPVPDANFDQRIRFEGVSLFVSGSKGQEAVVCASVDNAFASIRAQPQGRFQIHGSNGSGKSTLLAVIKARLGAQAFYLPTSDKLAFAFQVLPSANRRMNAIRRPLQAGFHPLGGSCEVCRKSSAGPTRPFLLDEWDVNMDEKNRASAETLVARLAARAGVVEISHRDRV